MNTMNFPITALQWAANNAGLRLEDLAAKISPSQKTREKILRGELSAPQAENLARLAKVPFGYLFLTTPPALHRSTVPDLRQTVNHEPLTDDFYDTLEDIKNKQEWFVDFLKEHDCEPLPFVGRFTPEQSKKDYKLIAEDIRKTLAMPDEPYVKCKTSDEYLNLLIARCEENQILIFRNSIVRSNTRRSLSPNEFRGFVIINKYAPAIFINGKDAKAAWIFTLAHELAHIWINLDGVIGDAISKPSDPIELACNKIAAELLVPEKCFLKNWELQNKSVAKIASIYKVSNLVIAKRAYDLKLIEKSEYSYFFDIAYRIDEKPDGSPSPYLTYPIRNSKLVTRHISMQAAIGELPLRDAARMLNISPKTVLELAKRNAHHD